jgi:glycosyltransferase involved in cell wall biosynthesis
MLKDKPKVSIVIPVFNGTNYLAQAIDSALAQTYNNIEVLVIDDGSTDSGATEKKALSYGDKIRYFRKPNEGVASALNFGIKKMEGEYFSWLSHDDLYERSKIADQIELVESLGGSHNIVACNARMLYQNGIKKPMKMDSQIFKHLSIFLATSARVGLNGCSLLIPRQALVESGGFNTSLPFTQDYDMWHRLGDKHGYRFVLLEKELVLYRVHANQDSLAKSELCVRAGDELRSKLLKEIPFSDYRGYFAERESNIDIFISDYKAYKESGHFHAASEMLRILFKYYDLHDKNKLYDIFLKEVDVHALKRMPLFRIKSSHFNVDDKKYVREAIPLLYSRIIGDNDILIPLKLSMPINMSELSASRRILWRISQNLKNEGIRITTQKLIKKVIQSH